MKILVILLLLLNFGYSKNKFNINDFVQYNELQYLPNDDKPFSGRVFDLYPNGEKKLSGFYKKGLKNRWRVDVWNV